MPFVQTLIDTVDTPWLDCAGRSIKESSPAATCTEAKFSFGGRKAIFKRPPLPSPEPIPFFHPHSGLKKLCDGIVFLEENATGEVYILCCELKSTGKDYLKQLVSSEHLAKFIFQSCLKKNPSLTNLKPIIRCILFSDGDEKSTVRPGASPYVTSVIAPHLKIAYAKCDTPYSAQGFCCH
jgi:hypothetical protein